MTEAQNKPEQIELRRKLFSGDGNPMFGKQHTEETKKTIGEKAKGNEPWNRGQKASDDFKEKVSKSLRGRYLSNEHKAKISAILKLRKCSEETRAKISKTTKGIPKTKEQIKKSRIGWLLGNYLKWFRTRDK